MAILKTEVYGRSLIGVYLEVNNAYLLYPPNLVKSELHKIKQIFEIDAYPFTVNNSKLVGIYSASNKYGIVLPHIMREDEFSRLKRSFSENKDKRQIATLKSLDNAFGNLILCNDKGAIISSLLSKYKSEIEDTLNVETVVFDFAGVHLPGAIGIANNNGCLVHPLTELRDIEFISSVLKVETDVSTINRGTPYLSAGAVVNDHAGIFGERSTGPEMMRLTNVLRL
jgi:translation initiation factor 6